MKEVITMHGWCGESSNWITWMQYFGQKGWLWQNNERGYGKLEPKLIEWSDHKFVDGLKKQILICHSLGLHLINKKVLEKASHIILLNSFSRFLTTSKNHRSISTALRGMKRAIGSVKEKEMMTKFLEKAYRPYSLSMSTSNLLSTGLSLYGRKKLAEDLELLIRTNGLPVGFPQKSLVLAIHGEKDAILSPSVKMGLINDLTDYLDIKPIHWSISEDGHSLLQPKLIHRVKEWIDSHP